MQTRIDRGEKYCYTVIVKASAHAVPRKGTHGRFLSLRNILCTNTQKWIFAHIGSNVYTIRSTKNNSYYLGIQNDSTADETPIVLRTGTVTNGMKWKVERGDEGYKIVSYSDQTMVLCTGTASATAGNNLKLSDFEGGKSSLMKRRQVL